MPKVHRPTAVALLAASTVAALAGCTVPIPTGAESPTDRLATLAIRQDTATPVPADIETAFRISGDPNGDQWIGSRCPVRSMVIGGQVRHARGDTGGLCGTATSGDWSPLFGGPVVHDPATLDVGYVIPLAEAWRSGMGDQNRDGTDRLEFATDEIWERVVITTGSDQQRGDRAPDAWKPAPPVQCSYATAWINAKWAWHLNITRAEHDALAGMIGSCSPNAAP